LFVDDPNAEKGIFRLPVRDYHLCLPCLLQWNGAEITINIIVIIISQLIIQCWSQTWRRRLVRL